MPFFQACNWRIATTEADLVRGYFHTWGLPLHLKIRYRDYSQKIPQGAGWSARHGYENLELNWEVLTQFQARFLKNIIEDALDLTGYIYLTVTPADGRSKWIDVRGAPHVPDIESADHSMTGIHHTNVSLFVNNVVIINDPATNLD